MTFFLSYRGVMVTGALIWFGSGAMATGSGVEMQRLLFGGLVRNAEMANGLAEVIISNVYGPGEVERQSPLEVYEVDGVWVVTGSYNKERNPGPGPTTLRIMKSDARVIDIMREEIIENPMMRDQ